MADGRTREARSPTSGGESRWVQRSQGLRPQARRGPRTPGRKRHALPSLAQKRQRLGRSRSACRGLHLPQSAPHLVVEITHVVQLEGVHEPPGLRFDDFLPSPRANVPRQGDGQDERRDRIRAEPSIRRPHPYEAALPSERNLALRDAHARRPRAYDDFFHCSERPTRGWATLKKGCEGLWHERRRFTGARREEERISAAVRSDERPHLVGADTQDGGASIGTSRPDVVAKPASDRSPGVRAAEPGGSGPGRARGPALRDSDCKSTGNMAEKSA